MQRWWVICVALLASACADECPDGAACEDGHTCCSSQQDGCCPLENAVCCEDRIHCCPEDSACHVEHSKCISLSTHEETPMWAMFPARRRAEWQNQKEVTTQPVSGPRPSRKIPESAAANTVLPRQEEVSTSPVTTRGNVPCDESVSCEDGSTCCKTKDGGWACCPFQEAVCCEDFIHCCPPGTKCNLTEQMCDEDSGSLPWVEKVPPSSREKERVTSVTCDSSHSCWDNETCCQTPGGEWACCPLPEAVCCEDHTHCCPKGTTCDPTFLTCQGPSGPLPMMEKLPAFKRMEASAQSQAITSTREVDLLTGGKRGAADNKPIEVWRGGEVRVQCDPKTTCPQHTTCCYMVDDKKWGCCPLEEAVCCADGQHCCPAHYQCDLSQTTCLKGEVVIPWYDKVPATAAADDPNTVECDAHIRCPKYATCCLLRTGAWGCCPLHEAVCCPDKEHCCPQGYRCSMDSATCQKLTLLQLRIVPLTRVSLTRPYHLQEGDIKCEGQVSCRDGETCCKMSSTTWGCCPYPDAVCCSDLVHCCPAGHSCGEGGSCVRTATARWDKWQTLLPKEKKALVL